MKYFTFKELLTTETGIANIPNWEQVENLKVLATFLDSIRSEYGKAIYVNSAFRSKEVNEKVGGVKTSYHCKGLAADIRCNNMKVLEEILRKHIDEIDQLGIYIDKKTGNRRWLHVGLPVTGKKPRHQTYYKYV